MSAPVDVRAIMARDNLWWRRLLRRWRAWRSHREREPTVADIMREMGKDYQRRSLKYVGFNDAEVEEIIKKPADPEPEQ
jgi:hypothetical protein